MKKTLLKIIAVILFLIMLLSVFLLLFTFINPDSEGFIDLTNVVRGFLVGISVLSAMIGSIAGWFGWKNDGK